MKYTTTLTRDRRENVLDSVFSALITSFLKGDIMIVSGYRIGGMAMVKASRFPKVFKQYT
jgi:hypothetical protein